MAEKEEKKDKPRSRVFVSDALAEFIDLALKTQPLLEFNDQVLQATAYEKMPRLIPHYDPTVVHNNGTLYSEMNRSSSNISIHADFMHQFQFPSRLPKIDYFELSHRVQYMNLLEKNFFDRSTASDSGPPTHYRTSTNLVYEYEGKVYESRPIAEYPFKQGKHGRLEIVPDPNVYGAHIPADAMKSIAEDFNQYIAREDGSASVFIRRK